MARVVCQTLSQPDRLTLIWSEGDAFFEPYHLSGSGLAEVRRTAARIRNAVSGLAAAESEGVEGTQLAQAGHDLYQQLFLANAGPVGERAREIRDWLTALETAGSLDSVEILSDAAQFIPWHLLCDRPDASNGFWGGRVNLCLGRRADPLRLLGVLDGPEILLAIDPHLRDNLPADQQKRLTEFAQANGLAMVTDKEGLRAEILAREVDLLYLFCTNSTDGFMLGDDLLAPAELRGLVRGAGDGEGASSTLLFLNACRGSNGAGVLAAVQEVGLTGFVAPEWPLPAAFANARGLDFLAAFLYQGEPLGRLLQRLRARTDSVIQWYTAVCRPDLRVRWPTDLDEAGTPPGQAATSLAAEPKPLPETPYRPLAPYDMEDRPLFVGRDGDVERFTELLDMADTRLLVLHGPSGVGKASLLRAGVIPYLEEDCVGYRFLRDRSEADDESVAEVDYPVLAIRATHNLAGQLAQALCAYCARPYSFMTPTGRTVVIDLPAILGDFAGTAARSANEDEEDTSSSAAVQADLPGAAAALPARQAAPLAAGLVERALRRDAGLFARVLAALGEPLPQELVLFIEQAEEMLTLVTDRKNRRASDLLRHVVAVSGHFKVIVSLRTEFFGRVSDHLRPSEGSLLPRSYLLEDLDAKTIAEAILLPTAREPILYSDDIPFEKYRLAFEKGLAEHIAREALAAARAGRDSALPVVHVVCAQLADLAQEREDRVIHASDLRTIKGIDGALAQYAQVLINSVSAAKPDRRALRGVVQELFTRQTDGTLCRDLVLEKTLAGQWKGAMPIDAVMDAAADDKVGLLEVTWLTDRDEEERFVSLAHDALVPVAARWAEEDERRRYTRKRVVDSLFITVPCILLALALAYRFYSGGRAAESRNEEAESEKKLLIQQLKIKEGEMQAARWTGYAGRLAQARQAWEVGNLVAFDQALRAAQDRLKDEPDLRGFEWYYLWQLGHGERATLSGHQGLVTSVALSPDGKVVASASADSTVKLWNAASGLERATLTGHKGPVNAVAFSGDGKLLASAGADGIIRLWDATTGGAEYVRTDKTLATLPGSGGPIRALAFTADAKTLASAGSDKKDMRETGVIRLWDVKALKETKVLLGHDGPVNAIAFAPDGKVLVSGGEDHVVLLWDVGKGKKQKALAGHPGPVNAVAFSANGKTVAAGGLGRKDGVDIGVVRLWDTETGKERGNLGGAPAGIFALAFVAGDKELVTGSRSNVVQVWDVASGQERRGFKGHVGWVRALAVSADGKTLATGSYDRTAKVWDMTSSSNPEVLPGQGPWVCSLAMAPKAAVLASGYSDGSLRLWNAVTGKEILKEKGHTGSVVAVAFSPKGNLLASGSWDEAKGTGELKLWDLKPGKKHLTLQGHAKGITSVAFSPDGRTLASGGADHKVILWDPETGQKKHEIAAHDGIVRCLAFSPEGHILATGGDDTRIRLWDTDTGKERPTTEAGKKGALRSAPFEGHTAPVLGLAFAPNSLSLASASADTTVKVWNVGTGTSHATLRGHGGVVFAVAFSPGGETLASGSWDHSVKLWDPDRGTERYTLIGHAAAVRALAFSPDHLLLASGSHDGTVRLWRAAPPEPEVMVPAEE